MNEFDNFYKGIRYFGYTDTNQLLNTWKLAGDVDLMLTLQEVYERTSLSFKFWLYKKLFRDTSLEDALRSFPHRGTDDWEKLENRYMRWHYPVSKILEKIGEVPDIPLFPVGKVVYTAEWSLVKEEYYTSGPYRITSTEKGTYAWYYTLDNGQHYTEEEIYLHPLQPKEVVTAPLSGKIASSFIENMTDLRAAWEYVKPLVDVKKAHDQYAFNYVWVQTLPYALRVVSTNGNQIHVCVLETKNNSERRLFALPLRIFKNLSTNAKSFAIHWGKINLQEKYWVEIDGLRVYTCKIVDMPPVPPVEGIMPMTPPMLEGLLEKAVKKPVFSIKVAKADLLPVLENHKKDASVELSAEHDLMRINKIALAANWGQDRVWIKINPYNLRDACKDMGQTISIHFRYPTDSWDVVHVQDGQQRFAMFTKMRD